MLFPINDSIKKYVKKNRISFSMPGHKGNSTVEEKGFFKLDVTELDDTDNLFSPKSYIADSQKKLSSVYNTVSSHYLLGGSTSGIYAMISLAVGEGDKIIVDRFCHKSVINAIILCGAVPVYAWPEYNYQFGITGGVLPVEIESVVEANPDAKAVIITSPTYYGTVSDISSIAKIVHKANMLLLVDEAHGAHFHVNDKLPESAVRCGADMVVQSVHKTLGALSGGALLHITTDRIPLWRIEEVLSMYHTSSPSYAVLSALESAAFGALKFNKHYEHIISIIDKCRKDINSNGKAYWVGEELIGGCGIFAIDKTRIVINFSKLAITGYGVAKILRTKYNIEVEMADENNIVCIATPYNKISHIKLLANAISDITGKMSVSAERKQIPERIAPQIITTPRKSYFSPYETIDMSDAAGRVSHSVICKYPPGIPLIVPGEEITSSHIKEITDTIEMGGTVTGIETDYRINVVR